MQRTSDGRARWDRFGLLEIMLLIAALAVGFALSAGAPRKVSVRGLVGPSFAGLILLGPLTLVSQAARGRRERPSVGEWFWLTPILAPVLIVISSLINGSPFSALTGTLLLIWLGLMIMQWFAAIVLFRMTMAGNREERPCRWTDATGLVVAILLPGMLLVMLLRGFP